MKKSYFVLVACVICTVTTIVISLSANCADSLFEANVEALTTVETQTSWSCDDSWGECYAHCGACGTTIRGRGDLTGSHSCN